MGHNNDVLIEKFKDIFPDKNIEAALIAMDNFDEMQAKAKQLVQIYKPAQGADVASLGACFMHTQEIKTPAKEKKGPPKVSNQHQLAPTQTNSMNQNGGPRCDDQKGFNKDNGSYQNTRGYFRENNFRESRGRGRGRGTHRKGGKPPWQNNNDSQGQGPQKGNDSQRGRGSGGQNYKNRGRGYDKQSQYSGRYSSPQQGQYQYMPPPPTPPQSLLPTPPPYDPNWQLRQTQFYNSPAVAGYAPQGQYPQCPAPSQNTGDRQNFRPS